jgi:hypothetical protein
LHACLLLLEGWRLLLEVVLFSFPLAAEVFETTAMSLLVTLGDCLYQQHVFQKPSFRFLYLPLVQQLNAQHYSWNCWRQGQKSIHKGLRQLVWEGFLPATYGEQEAADKGRVGDALWEGVGIPQKWHLMKGCDGG